MEIRKHYLVKQIAEKLIVNQSRVLDWIHSGELRAVNTSEPGRRPRWKISPDSLDEILATRCSRIAKQPTSNRRRTPKLPDVNEYV